MANPNYEDAFILAYTTGYKQVPQEKRNPFDGTITMTALEGEQMSFDDIGISTMRKKTTKFADIEHTDNEFRRRWLFPEFYYDAKLIDKQDNIAQHTDPTGAWMTGQIFAVERQKRDIVIASFDATVTGGKNPGDLSGGFTFTNTAISNAAGRTIVHDTKKDGTAGGVSTGLSVEKLILIREKFATLGNEDGTPIALAASFRQKSDLLREAEIQGTDTSEIKALVDGRIDSYMGIKFVTTNAITQGSSNDIDSDTNIYPCFAYIQEGIMAAYHLAPSFNVDRLVEKVGDTWQIKVNFGANAIRMHEDMVLKVECA